MIFGTIELELFFPNPQSLKEKRQILKSVLARLKNSMNVSVLEMDGLDKWQSSRVGVACIGNTRVDVDRSLNQVLGFFDREPELEVTGQQKQIW